jgi:uncharacterized protein
MDLHLLTENLSNPALLFFILGVLAVRVGSDIEIPPSSSKFISLYLLFAIGFKGGQELAHSHFGIDVLWSLVFGIALAALIPFYCFFILRKKLGTDNAGAIAAAYGSVSAVTFVTGLSYLESRGIQSSGHMVAIMALMEAPSILVGVILVRLYNGKNNGSPSFWHIIRHSFTNGSVFLIMGSIAIGFMSSDIQALGIKPFTTDLFKGFLAIFLLDMGISCGKKLNDFFRYGWFTLAFAIVIPLINGCAAAFISCFITDNIGDRLVFSLLAASASYIAVPAAMKIAIPKANTGIYVPMALAVTFPFNITIGMPLYFYLCGGF